MGDGILSVLEGAINTWNQAMRDITIHLTTTPDAFNGGGPWDVVASINTALQGIGYGLLMLFFLMSFLKYTTDFRELSFQQIIGWIVRFLLVKFLIDYCVGILTFCINISLGINDTIFSISGYDGTSQAVISDEVRNAFAAVQEGSVLEQIGAFFQEIPMLMMAGLGSILIWIAGAVMVMVVYLRFFKLFIYTALAPIPLAFFGSAETSSTGKHFLKSYFAVCLEICIIAVACVVFNAMVSSGYGGIFPTWQQNASGVNNDLWNVGMNYIIEMGLTFVMLAVVVFSSNKFVKEMISV